MFETLMRKIFKSHKKESRAKEFKNIKYIFTGENAEEIKRCLDKECYLTNVDGHLYSLFPGREIPPGSTIENLGLAWRITTPTGKMWYAMKR